MRPTLSIICFTVLSGAGYGIWLVLGLALALVWPACDAPFVNPSGGTSTVCWYPPLREHLFVAGFVLVTAGLLFSLGHLGKPLRAWRALSQWRSSWLSREGVAALLTYLPALAVVAAPRIQEWQGRRFPPGTGYTPWVTDETMSLIGVVLALMCVATVCCTANIYSSLKPIRAWHNRFVTPAYLLLALHTGLLWTWVLSALPNALVEIDAARSREIDAMLIALALTSLGLLALKSFYWRDVDAGSRSGTGRATGLESLGEVRAFEAPHTEENYLTHEMGFVLARKHARKLRLITLAGAFVAPGLLALLALAFPTARAAAAWLALVSGMLGVFVERWLFFAEARHAVIAYYGR
ncbi:MAG TPA: DmsC/YnfH family molybdoenzyme membrane anchor subunit [Rhodanobacteraceae bacterium]|nr:DmsC/YnfH family molybdoenzyme membrane anchor subunit [Rhodanobacteraceae bacterium]